MKRTLTVYLLCCCCALALGANVWPNPPPPSTRDPLQWPFANTSIWNLPIGQNAVYVPANVATALGSTILEADPDVLVLDSTATLPVVPFYYNSAGWSGASRCPAEGGALFEAPWPSDFIIANGLDNYAGAILLQDGLTIRQGQPLCHCEAGGNVTTLVQAPDVDLYGDGIRGAHGGSGMSSIGGTLRLGELVPPSQLKYRNNLQVDGVVRHALKGNLFAHMNYWRNGSDSQTCYRWPAVTCDGYFADPSSSLIYNGTNPALRPGALLALNSTVDVTKLGLTTWAGLQLAWTLQNYGLYLVDDTAWNVYALETELSPDRDYQAEFAQAWGFPFGGGSSHNWTKDVQAIYLNLNVVDNWNEALYEEVLASNGTMGAGGGAPRQPWAPPFVTASNSSSVRLSFSPPFLFLLLTCALFFVALL